MFVRHPCAVWFDNIQYVLLALWRSIHCRNYYYWFDVWTTCNYTVPTLKSFSEFNAILLSCGLSKQNNSKMTPQNHKNPNGRCNWKMRNGRYRRKQLPTKSSAVFKPQCPNASLTFTSIMRARDVSNIS